MSHELGAVLAAYMPEDGRNITANAWSELIGSLTDSVGRHHGSVIHVAGEGWFLARFQDALAAVSCAVEVQRALADRDVDVPGADTRRLHIGLNHEVPPDDGEAWPPDRDDRVDRLVAIAESGGICLSRTIYDDVRFQVDLPFDTMRDPKHTAYACQEIRRKFDDLNLLESSAVRLSPAALVGPTTQAASNSVTSDAGSGLIHRIKTYFD